MSDQPKDEWRNLTMPLNLYDRLLLQCHRILRANGEIGDHIFSTDKKVRTASRVDAIEFLTILCERTEDEKVFRV